MLGCFPRTPISFLFSGVKQQVRSLGRIKRLYSNARPKPTVFKFRSGFSTTLVALVDPLQLEKSKLVLHTYPLGNAFVEEQVLLRITSLYVSEGPLRRGFCTLSKASTTTSTETQDRVQKSIRIFLFFFGEMKSNRIVTSIQKRKFASNSPCKV